MQHTSFWLLRRKDWVGYGGAGGVGSEGLGRASDRTDTEEQDRIDEAYGNCRVVGWRRHGVRVLSLHLYEYWDGCLLSVIASI